MKGLLPVVLFSSLGIPCQAGMCVWKVLCSSWHKALAEPFQVVDIQWPPNPLVSWWFFYTKFTLWNRRSVLVCRLMCWRLLLSWWEACTWMQTPSSSNPLQRQKRYAQKLTTHTEEGICLEVCRQCQNACPEFVHWILWACFSLLRKLHRVIITVLISSCGLPLPLTVALCQHCAPSALMRT